MKLYQYQHCPFCIRVRMVLHRKSMPYECVDVLYDDVDTPTALVGRKQCPIMQFADGSLMKESGDIIARLETDYPAVLPRRVKLPADIRAALAAFRQTSNQLIKPRVIQAGFPEFATQAAQDYYRKKYEQRWQTSFAACMQQTPVLLPSMQQALYTLSTAIEAHQLLEQPFSHIDLQLFPAIACVTVVRELHFPGPLHDYLCQQAEASGFSLFFAVAL